MEELYSWDRKLNLSSWEPLSTFFQQDKSNMLDNYAIQISECEKSNNLLSAIYQTPQDSFNCHLEACIVRHWLCFSLVCLKLVWWGCSAGEEMEDFSSGGPFHQTHVAQSFFSDLFRDGSGTMTVSSNIYALSMRWLLLVLRLLLHLGFIITIIHKFSH